MGSVLRIVLLVIVGTALLVASHFLTSYDRAGLASLEETLGASLLFLAVLLSIVKMGTPAPARKAEPPPAAAPAPASSPEKPADKPA